VEEKKDLQIIDVSTVIERARIIYESSTHFKSLSGVKCHDLVRIDRDMAHMKSYPLQISNFQWAYAIVRYPGVGLFLAEKDVAIKRHESVDKHYPEIVLDIIRIRNLSVTYSDYVTNNVKGGGGELKWVYGDNVDYRRFSFVFNKLFFDGSGAMNYLDPVGSYSIHRYREESFFYSVVRVSEECNFDPVVLDTYDQVIFFFPCVRCVFCKFSKKSYIQLGYYRLCCSYDSLIYVMKKVECYIASFVSLRYPSLLSCIYGYGWKSDIVVSPHYARQVLFGFLLVILFGTLPVSISTKFSLCDENNKEIDIRTYCGLVIYMVVRSIGQCKEVEASHGVRDHILNPLGNKGLGLWL